MAMSRKFSYGGRYRGIHRELANDSRAQASFAVISVVLLLSTVAAAAYLSRNEISKRNQERQTELLEEMGEVVDTVSREMALLAAQNACEIMSSWSEFPVNESRISDRYSSTIAAYIRDVFPRLQNSLRVEVMNWTGGLFFIEKRSNDIVTSNKTTQESFEVDGSTMEFEAQAPPSEDMLAEVSSSPYFLAIGNFTVKVSGKSLVLQKEAAFERPVISALPLIESKLRTFESASSGEFSDLSKLVSYMLGTLVELRTLQGFGNPMYVEGADTDEVLTEEDVYKAVGVALLIEQSRLFRTIDPEFAAQVETICGAGSPGLPLLESAKSRTFDPAELYLWFIGVSRLNLEPRVLVAQAITSMADMLVLKVMDYAGWLGVLDWGKQLFDSVSSTLDSIIGLATGQDKASATVLAWVSKSLSLSGADPSSVLTMYTPPRDLTVIVPERVYYAEDGLGNLHPIWVGNLTAFCDVPERDLREVDDWAGFYRDFKDCQSSFSTLLRDAVRRLAFELAKLIELDFHSIAVDPSDGKDLFSEIARAIKGVRLSIDEDSLASLGDGLPFFSAQYELAQRFDAFLEASNKSITGVDELLDESLISVGDEVLANIRHQYIPDLVVPVEQQIEEIVRHDLSSDESWGVCLQVESALNSLASAKLESLARAINRSVTQVDDGFVGPIVDAVVEALASGVENVPSLGCLLEGQLAAFAKALVSQRTLSSHKQKAFVDSSGEFEFWDSNRSVAAASGSIFREHLTVDVMGGMPPLVSVPYDESTGYEGLKNLFPTDGLLVQVRRPWQFDRSEQDYPNLHMTAMSNGSVVPYSTCWTVSVLGMVSLQVSSESKSGLGALGFASPSSRANVRIEMCLPVIAHSPWPLDGVEYNPTNTAWGDAANAAKKFLEVVWDKMEPYVGWLKDGLERLWGFVAKVLQNFARYATDIIQSLSEAMQRLVDTLQRYVQKIANSALARAVQLFIDLVGTVELRISMFGFVVIVRTNLPDLLYRHGNDLLRVMLYTDRLGKGLTLGLRVAKLSDGSYDIVANGTIAFEHVKLDVSVDPMMHVLRRFLEAHCEAQTWRLDLSMPEVEPYEETSVTTASVPGVGAFLSNIPIPVLGLSASIEAGVRLKYSSPFPTDVVVNEFESNPAGDDSGKEWVELYNPLNSAKPLDGWTLETAHGARKALTLSGTIPPNGIKVFKFPETAIDNGQADDPFNNGDSIVLRDASGAIVDATPMLRDTANDARTNQRGWDGGPKWVFAQGSCDRTNGVPVLLASSDFIAKALFQAFAQAFEQTRLEEVGASLDFLKLFAKRVLNNFIENLLALVKEIIHEVIFFIEVQLSDASGSAGVGFRTSFVITGEAIRDLIRWLVHSLATFIVNLGRPSNPVTYPSVPQELFGWLYVRFEVLFEVGLPRMMRLLGAYGSLDGRFSLTVGMAPNIPALGRLVGRDWGNWSIDFGMCLEGVPKEFANGVLMKNHGDKVDFWILKGRLFGYGKPAK